MARKKKDGGGGGGSDWLNTYADMVTLLLTFFILLFSMSSLDAAKFNMLVAAFASDMDEADTLVIIGDAEGSPGGINRGDEAMQDITEDEMAEIFAQLQQYIEEQNLQDSVEVSKGEGYVFISFSDNMLFEPNSSRLRESDMELLNFVGYGIKSIQDAAEMILINGHTAEIVEDPDYAVSDRLLSAARANAVLMHFEDVIGIDSEKLIEVAYGKNYPIGDNTTPEGMSRNRRVEILISDENSLTAQLDMIYEKPVE